MTHARGSSLAERWLAFWFAPESARNLAATRIVIAVHALWIVLSRDLPAQSGIPAEFYANVSRAARWRYLIFEGNVGIEMLLQGVTIALLVMAALGVLPRFACFGAGLLLYHLAPLQTFYWTLAPYERGLTISVPALIVLSAAPCGDALSILRRRPAPRRDPGDYGWAVKLVQLFLCQIYLFSGWAKLYNEGLDWISAANLREWLLLFHQQDHVGTFETLGPWIAERPPLAFGAAVFGVVIDFGFVLALVSRRLRPWILGLALVFHGGVLLTLNIAFLSVPQLLVFVDWGGRGSAAEERGPRSLPQDPAPRGA